jgi:1-acyl-sn-glycerol-3-phosphate acyltransferase
MNAGKTTPDEAADLGLTDPAGGAAGPTAEDAGGPAPIQPRMRLARWRPTSVLMNLWVYPLMVLWTLVGIILFLPAFAAWKLVTGWSPDRIMHHYIWIYGRVWLGVLWPFVRFRREGFAGREVRPPCICVVNHLSFLDTYFMGGLPFFDVVFMVRSWPFRMFWYAPFMRLAHYVDIESRSWDETLAACRREIASARYLLFFPEGHRSRDGGLGRFYSGAFKLAVETGLPIVPLGLSGTDRLLPPGYLWLQPATVRLRALPAVDPAAFAGPLGHLELRRHVKDLMARAIAEMRAEDADV